MKTTKVEETSLRVDEGVMPNIKTKQKTTL
jgi:hypothetical protein